VELTVGDVFWRLAGLFALVFANGFFVAAEFSIVSVRKTRIDQLIAEGHRAARCVRRAISDPDRYIAATQLGITMASLGLGWIGEPALAALIQPLFTAVPTQIAEATAHSIAIAIAFVIVTALHIIFGELAPKTIALERAEKTALLVVKPTELFMQGFWPFIRVLNGAGLAVVRLLGLRSKGGHAMVHSEEELKMLVTASQEAGVLEENEEQMLHRVFGFADLKAGQIMTPRTEVVAVAADTPLEALIQTVVGSRQTRLAVYRTNLDDVVGFLYVTDLIRAMASPGAPVDAVSLTREALMVPETLAADQVLDEMRRRGVREAVVIDEYGGTAGVITFESLIERIVGDAAVESGTPARITVLSDGSAEIDGLALVRDVNVQFGLHIDEETYNTVGGYVLGRLGRRARVGDTIEIEGRRMRVEHLDGLRVARIRLSVPPKGAALPRSEPRPT
jgi:magnesium and cobalt exporter, CNNM family